MVAVERALAGAKAVYYVVQVRDMTVWVPADIKVRSRLRSPTSKPRFTRLLAVLSSPSESLPTDRLERKNHLVALLEDCRPESLCQVIRDLSAYQKQLGKPDAWHGVERVMPGDASDTYRRPACHRISSE